MGSSAKKSLEGDFAATAGFGAALGGIPVICASIE
jgi:hypothetical protein